MTANKSMSCGIIGFGAFGRFMAKHLATYFTLSIYDNANERDAGTNIPNAHFAPLEAVCGCDIVIYAAPVQALEHGLQDIKDKLNPECLFIDVCSVKVKPVAHVLNILPETIDFISLHPLFGPQSGRNGIGNLNIAMCDVRSHRGQCVTLFLKEKLNLNVIETTPEKHDKDMSYVMGLTHMMAKVFAMMDVGETAQTTRTYDLLLEMVDMIKDDSDDLFLAIQEENPFVEDTKSRFFDAVSKLQTRLDRKQAEIEKI